MCPDNSKEMETSHPAVAVEQAAILLEKNIGMQYFKEGVESLKEGDPGGAGMGRYGYPASVPPLAYIWCRAREELIFGELGGEFKAGYASARLRALGADLSILERIVGLEKVLELLKKSDSFELACFTLSVAAVYRRKEIPVLFTDDIDPESAAITIVPQDTPLTICCIQWEIKPGMEEYNHIQEDEYFSIKKLSPKENMPELLYINVMENQPSPKPGPVVSGAITRWLKETGSKAVIMSHGILQTGRKGLTFSRDYLPTINPDFPDSSFTENNIYMPS